MASLCFLGFPSHRASHTFRAKRRESGGIGRRTSLRSWRRDPWGFESPLSHHIEGSERLSASGFGFVGGVVQVVNDSAGQHVSDRPDRFSSVESRADRRRRSYPAPRGSGGRLRRGIHGLLGRIGLRVCGAFGGRATDGARRRAAFGQSASRLDGGSRTGGRRTAFALGGKHRLAVASGHGEQSDHRSKKDAI